MTYGYLWIATGEGLCRYDGQNFRTYTTKEGLAEDVVTSTFIGPDGHPMGRDTTAEKFPG